MTESLAAARASWREWLKSERRLSGHTLIAYEHDVDSFLGFLATYLGAPPTLTPGALDLDIKSGAPPSTSIALVATDAVMTKAQAKRLALMADDGIARAIRPAHAPMDGDTVIAAAMLKKPMAEGPMHLTEIGLAAADCVARSVARAVYAASALPFPGAAPAWRDRFAGAREP